MKAIQLNGGGEFVVGQLIDGQIKLISIKTGKPKIVDYSFFKENYKLAEDDEIMPFDEITPEPEELEEAPQRAKEIIQEATQAATKARNIIRLDFREKPVSEKKEKTPKGPKPEREKKSAGNMTTLKDICDELKIDPSKARRVLRKNQVESEGKSWEWSNQETIEKIKKLLK